MFLSTLKEGIIKNENSITNLMENLDWSTEQAMKALGISDNEKPIYEDLIKESKATYDV